MHTMTFTGHEVITLSERNPPPGATHHHHVNQRAGALWWLWGWLQGGGSNGVAGANPCGDRTGPCLSCTAACVDLNVGCPDPGPRTHRKDGTFLVSAPCCRDRGGGGGGECGVCEVSSTNLPRICNYGHVISSQQRDSEG